MGNFFPRELREEKVREFLTLKEESMIEQDYNFMFRSRMSLFLYGSSR